MAVVGVKDYMTRGVPTIAPEADLKEAVKRLRSSDAGLVAVCDRGRLVGTITEHALGNGSTKAYGDGAKVADALPPDLSYCFEDTDVLEAERLMRNNGLDRIVVLDRHGHTVGILALATLTRSRAE